jgi:hypothetical protein
MKSYNPNSKDDTGILSSKMVEQGQDFDKTMGLIETGVNVVGSVGGLVAGGIKSVPKVAKVGDATANVVDKLGSHNAKLDKLMEQPGFLDEASKKMGIVDGINIDETITGPINFQMNTPKKVNDGFKLNEPVIGDPSSIGTIRAHKTAFNLGDKTSFSPNSYFGDISSLLNSVSPDGYKALKGKLNSYK